MILVAPANLVLVSYRAQPVSARRHLAWRPPHRRTVISALLGSSGLDAFATTQSSDRSRRPLARTPDNPRSLPCLWTVCGRRLVLSVLRPSAIAWQDIPAA